MMIVGNVQEGAKLGREQILSFHLTQKVLELPGTGGTSCFRQRWCLARLVGLILI